MTRQKRRLRSEPELPRHVHDQSHLLWSAGEAVKCQYPRCTPGDQQGIRDTFTHQRTARALGGARAHASPRLMPYARIFLCRFVRSTPSKTAAFEMFQSRVFNVSMM